MATVPPEGEQQRSERAAERPSENVARRKPADWHPISAAHQRVLLAEFVDDLLTRVVRRYRARVDQAAADVATDPAEPAQPSDELSPAQKARARAAHARRLAAEQREGER